MTKFTPLICALLLGACATPTVRYWSLRSDLPATPVSNSTCTVQIAPLSVPETYDRADIVLSTGTGQVTWVSTEQWEAPLPEVLSGRIASSLARELGVQSVYTWPSILAEPPTYNVSIQLPQIQAILGHKVAMSTHWSIGSAAGKSVNGSAVFAQTPTGPGYSELVNAMGLTTDEVASAIAADIKKIGGCASHTASP